MHSNNCVNRITGKHPLELDQAHVARLLAEKAEEFGTTINALQAELSQGDGIQPLKDMLLAESTLAYLVEKNK